MKTATCAGIIMISHDLECERGQFHLRVHILKSQTRLTELLMKETLNLWVEMSHFTLLTINSYFLSPFGKNWIVFPTIGRNNITSLLCGLKKNLFTIFEIIVCILVYILDIKLRDDFFQLFN